MHELQRHVVKEGKTDLKQTKDKLEITYALVKDYNVDVFLFYHVAMWSKWMI